MNAVPQRSGSTREDPVVLSRTTGATGGELVLRRVGGHFEIISNGVFLMDTRDGRSERAMVRASLRRVSRIIPGSRPPGLRSLRRSARTANQDEPRRSACEPRPGRPLAGPPLRDHREAAQQGNPEASKRHALDALPAADVRVLIGGLGAGFSAREALDDPRVSEVCVVELEPLVVEWHAGPLGVAADRVPDDPRCTVVCADLLRWIDATAETFDVICLDIDNGPEWTVADGNGALYGPEGLARLEPRLRPGGVLAFWSAMPSPAFAGLLRARYGGVDTVAVPTAKGGPDLVYLVRPPGR